MWVVNSICLSAVRQKSVCASAYLCLCECIYIKFGLCNQCYGYFCPFTMCQMLFHLLGAYMDLRTKCYSISPYWSPEKSINSSTFVSCHHLTVKTESQKFSEEEGVRNWGVGSWGCSADTQMKSRAGLSGSWGCQKSEMEPGAKARIRICQDPETGSGFARSQESKPEIQ